jgi:hypothetical protein
MTRKVKVIVEKHEDGHVAYPLGLRPGVAIVGEADTSAGALADVTSAIRFTLETRPESEVFDDELPVLHVTVAEAEVGAFSSRTARP